MSVSFTISKESLKMIDGKIVAVYETVYPEGFDSTPRIDPEMPEYGPIHPENPWEMNVSNSNFCDIVKTLGLWETQNHEDGEYVGSLDPNALIVSCESALEAIMALPELDASID